MNYNRTNFKISFAEDSAKFYVNEKKKTVTCSLVGELVTPIGSYFYDPMVPEATLKGTATAKCSPNDTFDVNRGKRIALAKAENKIYLGALRHINEFTDKMNMIINARDEFAEKTYACCAHNEEYIDSLSYPEHPNYKEEVTEPKRGRE